MLHAVEFDSVVEIAPGVEPGQRGFQRANRDVLKRLPDEFGSLGLAELGKAKRQVHFGNVSAGTGEVVTRSADNATDAYHGS